MLEMFEMIKPVTEFIAEAKTQCKCLDSLSALEFYNQNANTTIIDVREPGETEKDKLSMSVNIPRGLLEMKIEKTCPDADQPILTHCGGGGRASMAAARLQEMGYTNVFAIDAKYEDLKTVFEKD